MCGPDDCCGGWWTIPVMLFDIFCRCGRRYHSWEINKLKDTLRQWGYERQPQGVVDDTTGGIIVSTHRGTFNPQPLVPWPPALDGKMTAEEYRSLVTELACAYWDCLLGRKVAEAWERGNEQLEHAGRSLAAFVESVKEQWLQRGVRLSFVCEEIKLTSGNPQLGSWSRMMHLHIDPVVQAGSTEIPLVVAASPLLESPMQGHSLAAPPVYASAPPAASMGSGGVIHVRAAPPSHTMSDDNGGGSSPEGVPAASAPFSDSSKLERLEQENAVMKQRMEQLEQALAKQQQAELQPGLKEGGK